MVQIHPKIYHSAGANGGRRCLLALKLNMFRFHNRGQIECFNTTRFFVAFELKNSKNTTRKQSVFFYGVNIAQSKTAGGPN